MSSGSQLADATGQPAGSLAPDPGLDSVDSYLARVLAFIRVIRPTKVGLDRADGTVLAADVVASCPLPPFDNSAMDGYAVLAADVATASPQAPVRLRVIAETAAGATSSCHASPGTCVRIMTGAAIPSGADAVVRVEWTDGGDDHVMIRQPVPAGCSIRSAGADVRPGDVLLTAGTRLGPPQLGLLAAAGLSRVLARRRPRVAIFSVGDELTPPGQPLRPGSIWESNSVMLAAAARAAGCSVRRPPIVPDDAGDLLAALRRQARTTDLLLTSSGVSMGGEHDVVKAALSRLGTVSFRKVAMHPGMPQGAGTLEPGTAIITLPGNPASAYLSFLLFVLPAIRALQGLPPGRPRTARAVLTDPLVSPAGKRSFLSAYHDPDAGSVMPWPAHHAHRLSALATANALVVVPERTTRLSAGDPVEVLELSSAGYNISL